MRGAAAWTIALAAALAGCTGGDDGPPADDAGGAPQPAPDATTNETDPEEPPEEPDGPRSPPPVTQWDLSPVAGCEGSLLEGGCVSFQTGPDAPAVDGHWIEWGQAYWNWTFTSGTDSVLGDTDCYLVGAGGSILGDRNNGAEACGGTIPQGAAWLFIYAYAEPAQGITVTIEV